MANEVDKAPEYTLVVTERVANEKYEPRRRDHYGNSFCVGPDEPQFIERGVLSVSLTAEEFNDMRLELLSRWKAAPR